MRAVNDDLCANAEDFVLGQSITDDRLGAGINERDARRLAHSRERGAREKFIGDADEVIACSLVATIDIKRDRPKAAGQAKTVRWKLRGPRRELIFLWRSPAKLLPLSKRREFAARQDWNDVITVGYQARSE